MKVQDLITQLQQFPPDMEVCIFDWKHNMQMSDGSELISDGIYSTFEIYKTDFEADTDDEDAKPFVPWIALAFDNPLIEDFEEMPDLTQPRSCRICGCTDDDCSKCITKTGHPCHWVEKDLCSTCIEVPDEFVDKNVNRIQEMLAEQRTKLKLSLPDQVDEITLALANQDCK